MAHADSSTQWFMPDEAHPHERTWMAFGASRRIWGRQLLPQVQQDLALIANTIARYEPITLLVRENERALARTLLDPTVELLSSPLDDLWIRDTGPVFVLSAQGQQAAIDFNFNGWGAKQAFTHDAQVAARVARAAQVPLLNTHLVLEGGSLEVDGQGTAILTESSVLNPNRNPGVSKAALEDTLMPLLGLEKIIWLPGIRGMDITDGHVDFYARFATPGVVLAAYEPDPSYADHEVTLQHLEILRAATDARGRRLSVQILEAPGTLRYRHADEDFAAGYLGFYLCNGAVIMQTFGDSRADTAARHTLASAFPQRRIEQLAVDALAAGGGSIHCATQQQPIASRFPRQYHHHSS